MKKLSKKDLIRTITVILICLIAIIAVLVGRKLIVSAYDHAQNKKWADDFEGKLSDKGVLESAKVTLLLPINNGGPFNYKNVPDESKIRAALSGFKVDRIGFDEETDDAVLYIRLMFDDDGHTYYASVKCSADGEMRVLYNDYCFFGEAPGMTEIIRSAVEGQIEQ